MITFFYILGVLIGLILIIAMLISNDSFVEQKLTINKSASVIYEYARFIINHDNFSVWATMDPEMKKEYTGKDGEVGFVFNWQSEKKSNVGTGEQEIKKLIANHIIEHELRFIKPFESVAQMVMSLHEIEANKAEVIWSVKSQMKFPVNIMKPMVENLLRKNLNTGLQNLKQVLERS